MASNTTRLYENFQPGERLTLLLEALARGDEAEAKRLRDSCPRKTYTQQDAAFDDRISMAFDVMAVVCIDLRGLWGKLHILEWAMSATRQLATWQQINCTMAFMDGVGHGKGRPQMEFFSKGPFADAEDGDDEGGDDAEAIEAAPQRDHDHRLSQVLSLDLAKRMAAVEDRAQHTTDSVFLQLLQTAHELARDLANVWAAFDRFCRTRAGVSAETMLDAWGFPVAEDFLEMLKRYERVKADPAKVEEYFGLICMSWDKRFCEGE